MSPPLRRPSLFLSPYRGLPATDRTMMMIETYFPRPAWFVNGATARRCRYDTVCDSASRSACCLRHSRLARGAYRRGLAGPQPADSGSARPQVRVRLKWLANLPSRRRLGNFGSSKEKRIWVIREEEIRERRNSRRNPSLLRRKNARRKRTRRTNNSPVLSGDHCVLAADCWCSTTNWRTGNAGRVCSECG